MKIARALPDIKPLNISELLWIATSVCCNPNTLDEAEKRCKELLQFLAQLPEAEESVLAIQAIALMGDIYSHMDQAKWQQAFNWYQQTIEKSEFVLGPDNGFALAALNAQIRLLRKLGQHEEADKLDSQRDAVARFGRLENTVEAAASYESVGGALLQKGQYGKAEPLLKQALSVRQRLLGTCHLDTGKSLNNLAELYKLMGRYKEAQPLCEEALDITRKELGGRHLVTATCLNHLAELYKLMGRYEEAEPLHKKALGIRKRELSDHHLDTANSLNNLATLYRLMDRYREAELMYEEALNICQKELGERHPTIAINLYNLAELNYKTQRFGQALVYIRQSLYIYIPTLFQLWVTITPPRKPLTAYSKPLNRRSQEMLIKTKIRLCIGCCWRWCDVVKSSVIRRQQPN